MTFVESERNTLYYLNAVVAAVSFVLNIGYQKTTIVQFWQKKKRKLINPEATFSVEFIMALKTK